ncbi:MAG: dihydroxyacetone kinase subunit DhaK [Steroidobacteraceae bacterium]
MKKFMNGAESMLTESLSGFAKAHQDIIVVDQEFRYVRRKRAKAGGRVALISGGGGGHEPLQLGRRVNEMTRSMGVALSSCTVPAVGRPTFELGEDEMEMGVGIHGEAGRRRVPFRSANAIAEELVQCVTHDLQAAGGSRALLLVNGFGGTPASELYLMYDAAERQVAKYGLKVTRSLVGSYVTSLEMAGCSITVTLLDEQMTTLWDAPVHTAALRW